MWDKMMLRDTRRCKTTAWSSPSLLTCSVSARLTDGLLSCFLMHHNLPKVGHYLAVTVQPVACHSRVRNTQRTQPFSSLLKLLPHELLGQMGNSCSLIQKVGTDVTHLEETCSGLGRVFKEKTIPGLFPVSSPCTSIAV